MKASGHDIELSDYERLILSRYTYARRIVVEGEPEARTVWFNIQGQQFCITPHYVDNEEEAYWFRAMMAKALAKLIEEERQS